MSRPSTLVPHRRRRRGVAATISAAMVIAACSGGSDSATPETTAAPDGDTPAASTAPATTAAPGTTFASTDVETSLIAARWLRDTSGLDEALVDQLSEVRVQDAGPVAHVEYQHIIDGRRVLDSEVVVHVLADGNVQGATSSLVEATPRAQTATIDELTARNTAEKAVDGLAEANGDAEPVWDQVGNELLPAWLVSVSAFDPVGAWRVVIDATTGNVLSADRAADGAHAFGTPRAIGDSLPQGSPAQAAAKGGPAQALPAQALPAQSLPAQALPAQSLPAQASDACDVGAAPSACVFYNPFAQSGGPVNPPSANDFLFPVELLGLVDDDRLSGAYVDTDFAGTPVPPPAEGDGTWAGGVGSRNFEAAMAYYWIDRTQRAMQGLGFAIRDDVSTKVVPLFPNERDNAFFDALENRIYLGVGSNGIHAAHDAFVIVHEYGHAVLDTQLGTETHFSSQPLAAYSEGFSDLLAALSTIELHRGEPSCVGGWFVTLNSCFRDLDNTKQFPDDLAYLPHDDGELFAGAVWDAFQGLLAIEGLTPADCATDPACLPVRDRMLQVLLGASYYITAGADFFDISSAYLRANEAGFADADRDVFETAFAERGLLGTADTTLPGDGSGPEQRDASVSLIVDVQHEYRGDLRLTAGVVDADFEPLCTEIVLAEPDADDDGDNLFGTVDVTDTDCAAFVPPGPDQLWYLFAADELADDEGEIVEFVIDVDGAPYPAVDLPRPIPDADPDGTAVIVDGGVEPVPEEGQVQPGAPTPGQPFITLDITHTYTGDLFVRAGVADADDDIVCSVAIRNPDAADDSGGLIGSVDMSECAAFFPPSPSQQWFLQVIDTARVDEGTVDQFSLTGPNGIVFEFEDVPVEIPDNDVDGVALIITDGGSGTGTAGGSGQGSTVPLPTVSFEIDHTYVGDLAVAAGVADANFAPICEVVLNTPDGEDSSDDLAATASLADCAEFYPPSPDQIWYLYVRDSFSGDTGAVRRFTLQGPDGQVFNSVDGGTLIPDADPTGVALLIDGSDSGVADDQAIASVIIEHSYAGDLFIQLGVTGGDGGSLCDTVVQIPDPNNANIDLATTVDLSECVQAGLYPPTQESIWFLFVRDTAELDVGTLEAWLLVGPDGVVRSAAGITPSLIPDDDEDGLFVFFDS